MDRPLPAAEAAGSFHFPRSTDRGAISARDHGRVALGRFPAQTRVYDRRPMTPDQTAASALDFGTGTSDDHRDGIRWVDYTNISWNPVFCKRCDICVKICPKATLVLRNDAIIEEENCILCGLCERYCPDLAIEMIPEAVVAHAAKGA